jgi:hypothetical protein
MLSVLSIVLVLMIKSMDISAKDYNNFRFLVYAIPSDPSLVPFPMETQLDSIVFTLAQSNGIFESEHPEFDLNASFEAYEKLKLVATEAELNELMLHESPIVRVYAYRALIVNAMSMNCDYEGQLLLDSTCVDWVENGAIVNTTVSNLVQQTYFE